MPDTEPDNPLLADLKAQVPAPGPDMGVRSHTHTSQRDAVCGEAGNELFVWLTEWRKRHELTGAEYLLILQQIQSFQLSAVITAERAGVFPATT